MTASSWCTVFELETDDPICISEQDWHFASDSLAYGHVLDEYVATSDGGRSWIRWHVSDLSLEDIHGGVDIASVRIEADGRGTMMLHTWNTAGKQGTILAHTANYGRAWAVAKPGHAT